MKKFLIPIVLMMCVCMFSLSERTYGVTVTYNSITEQMLFSSADAPAQPQPFTPGDCPDCPFDLINNTGEMWTDFHFDLRLGPGSFGTFVFINFVGGGYDGTGYEGPGIATFSNPGPEAGTSLDVVGLNIPNGGTYSFTVDMDALELLGTYELFGTPTTDGVIPAPIPEPSTYFMFATGLLGLLAYAWRRRKRAA